MLVFTRNFSGKKIPVVYHYISSFHDLKVRVL